MASDERLRVAVLMGGRSPEHDVSIHTGLNVLDALDPERYVATPVWIDRRGRWHIGVRPLAPSLDRAPGDAAGEVLPPADPEGVDTAPSGDVRGTLERLQGGVEFDVAFVALHGPGGEDGTLQGLLRVAELPFTGSGVLASALAMDKARTKALLAASGLAVPREAILAAAGLLDGVAISGADRERIAVLGMPCVVKPTAGGSSVATRIVTEPSALEAALRDAAELGTTVMVEEFVEGVEVTCGVLGGGPHEQAEALPLTEIEPADSGFFDFRAKYTAGACREITPARVSAEVSAEVQKAAVRAHELLGCEGMSRADFIVRDDRPLLLEVNTIPGLTETSLLPQGAAAAGISFAELVERLLRSALRRGTG